MKIGLINTYSCNNIGDAAIYAALSKMLSGHQVYANLTDNNGITPEGIQYSSDLSGCEGYISVGGDIFNNARPWFITRNFISNINGLRKSPKTTFLFGQSIPSSCQGLSLKLLANQLKQIASVTVRDLETFRLLKNLGVDCKLSFDTAFALECSEPAIKYAAEILNTINAPKSAVISLREFNALYPADNENFIRNIVILCRLLKESQHQPVLLIQSTVSELDNDWLIARAIQAQCPDVKIIDLVKYSSAFPSWELLQAILKNAGLIVAVRYHTAVLALTAGRTPYNLYYSNKGADLTHRLGIPGGHIEHFNPKQSIGLIEKTGLMTFNAESIRQTVQNDFKMALDNCIASQQLIKKHHEFA